MLVDGVPSPRFARYMRNLERLHSWTATLLDLFLTGPARWLALAAASLLVTCERKPARCPDFVSPGAVEVRPSGGVHAGPAALPHERRDSRHRGKGN